jgi:hypothetical protein
VATTTVRLPDELDEQLATYCAQTGAVKNRVVALALRAWLGDGPAPALHVQPLPEVEQAVEAALRTDLDAALVEGATPA